MIYKKLFILISIFTILLLTGCDSPTPFGSKVEKTYFTGGKVSSTYTWEDSTGKNGILKKYGYNGKITSSVHIVNAVKDGIESMYDDHGRIIQQIPYVNGRIHGTKVAFYPNGDKMITYTYQYGMKNGYAYAYNPDGTVAKKARYKNNRLVR
jgi:antitoxin component YwqK of YwqJK toxin-antitoxin module